MATSVRTVAARWVPLITLRVLPGALVVSSALASADSKRWAVLNVVASLVAAISLLAGPSLEKWLPRFRLRELPQVERVILVDCIARSDEECIRRAIAKLNLEKDQEDHLLHWIQRNPGKAQKLLSGSR